MEFTYILLAGVFAMAVIGDGVGLFLSFQINTRVSQHEKRLNGHDEEIKGIRQEIIDLTRLVTEQFAGYLKLLDEKNDKLANALQRQNKKKKTV